ncbi:MAG: YbaK/EbsC family protein [Acidobacteria bacterium]|nr:YbaK/EbsC family protein [Acidobacteriota bacterium]
MTIPEATQRVVEAGRVLGFEVDVHFFPEGTKTSQDAADAIGCQLSAIAKSIVLTLDEAEQVVVFASGDTRIDLELLARAAGATSARRATLDEARSATGFAAGGTPPIGYPGPVRVFADMALRRHLEVWSAGGTPTTVFPIPLQTLVDLTGATWVEATEQPVTGVNSR